MEQVLSSIIKKNKLDSGGFQGYVPDLSYVEKWVAYRDSRIESENPFPSISSQHILFNLRKQTEMTALFVKELRNQHREYFAFLKV